MNEPDKHSTNRKAHEIDNRSKGRPWSRQRTKFDRNLAVIIGIDRYDHHPRIHNLSTAVNDAREIADVLQTHYGYEEKNIIRLFSPCSEDTTKALNQPCKAATLDNLKILLNEDLPKRLELTEGDRLLFYFAGHGIPLESQDGPAGYLIPQTARLGDLKTYLPMRELHAALIQLHCHHLLIILDCCFGGMFRWASSRKLISVLETVRREHYDRFIRYPAWQVITSAAHNEEALDLSVDHRKTEENSRHSPFAQALIEGLTPDHTGQTKADFIPDGVITAHELFLHLNNRVSELSNSRQTPGIYPMRLEYDKGEYIFTNPNFKRDDLDPAPDLNEENNPYRGLKPFDEKHSPFFFGRDTLIEKLSKRLTKCGCSLTVVLGASGSGKSSLVKAGLIPHLREQNKKQSQQWYVLVPMRPGKFPFIELARAILPIVNPHLIEQLTQCKDVTDSIFDQLADVWNHATPEAKLLLVVDYFEQLKTTCSSLKLENLRDKIQVTVDQLSRALQNDSQYLSQAIAAWSQNHPNTKLLIVVDQFEELITMAQEHQERQQPGQPNQQTKDAETQQFLKMLRVILANHRDRLHLVLTLRSDFEPRFLDSALKSHWRRGRFPVRAMNSDELRQSIEGPALKQALVFNPDNLVSTLIDEVGQMPGALPLLSFALSELYIKLHQRWQEDGSTDRSLTLEDYTALGGVSGSLTRRATEEYDKLINDKHNNEYQEGKACQATMRRVILRMVATEGGGVARRRVLRSELTYPEPKENNRVEKVIDQLVNVRLLVKGQEDGEPYVEPAHDFLIRGWDKLQEWIGEEREDLILQQRLTAITHDWCNDNKHIRFLWKDDSRVDRLEEIGKSENSWLNQQESDFVKACVTLRDQREQESLDTSLEIAITSSQRLFDAGKKFDALTTLTKTGKNLALGLEKYESSRLYFLISLRDMFGKLEPCESIAAHEEAVTSISFNADKNIIASSDSETIKLWNVDGTIRQTLERKRGNEVKDLDFSRSGEFLAAADEHGNIDLWQISKNSKDTIEKDAFLFHKEFSRFTSTNCIRFKPNDQTLISCDGSTVVLWTAEGGSVDPSMVLGDATSISDDIVTCVAFSPDGEVIAVGYVNGFVKLWKLDGTKIFTHKAAENGSVNSVNFSHDGKTLAVGCTDELQLWAIKENPIEPKQTLFLEDHIEYVVFSADDSLLAAVDAQNTITLWLQNDKDWLDADNQPKKLRTLKHNKIVTKICFPENSNQANSLMFNCGTTIQSWSYIDQFSGYCKKDRRFYGHTNRIVSIAFSRDAKTVATVSLDRTIKLWDSSGLLLETLYNGEQDYELGGRVKISQDGQIIIAVLKVGKVIVWRKNDNLKYDRIHEEEEFFSEFDLSSSGDFYLTVDGDNAVMKIFGLRRNKYQFLFEESNQIKANFDSTGEVITSLGANQSIHVWRVANGSFVRTNSGFENAENDIQYANLFYTDSLVSEPQSWMITVDETSELSIWKMDREREKKELARKIKRDVETRVIDLQFTGKTVLILSEPNTGEFYIELYSLDFTSTKTKTVSLTPGSLTTLSLNIDCSVITVADFETEDYENRIRFWDLDLANLEEPTSFKSGIRSKLEMINE